MKHNMTQDFCGVLPLDKSAGMTSHDAVNKIRRLFGTKQVGHTGTLDPMATGVLVLLIGRAAKAAEYIASDEKGYAATLRLGVATDTEDITGRVLAISNDIPDEAAVVGSLDKFRGDILQTPPMYSALKIDGQKLCDLARKGIEVGRAARPITVFRLEAQKIDRENYALAVECSKGTYIRTLCKDIGESLGCGGTMASLRRTRAGRFTLDNCATLKALEAMTPAERGARLLPLDELFAESPEIILSDFHTKLIRSGQSLTAEQVGTSLPKGRVRLSDKDGFFALGEIEHGAAKAIKTFRL